MDLEDEVEPPEELFLRRWDGIANRFGERDGSASTERSGQEVEQEKDALSIASSEMEKLNLNKNRMSEAFGCYPYVLSIFSLLNIILL